MAKKFSIGNANPAMSRIGKMAKERGFAGTDDTPMTLQGTINKSLMLIGILMVTASLTWNMATTNPGQAMALMMGGMIGGLIVALVIIFKQEWAPKLAWLYAALEGLFLGAISAQYAAVFEGIVFQAVGLTILTLALMLILYRFEIIKVTEKFRSTIIAATMGIMVFYVLTWILGMFGVGIPGVFDGGWMSIGISLFIVVIAALNLLLDFDMIETGIQAKAPSYYEWYAGFSLLITLVWLYLELLRLLSYLSSD
ncbi:MAG: Bax inhibitor-1/YccA family protein [Saprospiraceae bacterium]